MRRNTRSFRSRNKGAGGIRDCYNNSTWDAGISQGISNDTLSYVDAKCAVAMLDSARAICLRF